MSACDETFRALDTDFLTGFTSRVAAALCHLRDAWCNADPTNSTGVVMAIASLFTTRSVEARPDAYRRFLVHGLDEEKGEQLWDEVRLVLAELKMYPVGMVLQ